MNYFQLLFPDFFLIFLGYIICNLTALNSSIWKSTEVITYYLFLPVLLFSSITKYSLSFGATIIFLTSSLCLIFLAIFLSYIIPIINKNTDKYNHASVAQISFRFNSFIALALTTRLLFDEGVLYISILMGFCIPIVNIAAVWPMLKTRNFKSFIFEIIKNPLIIATILGLIANLTGFKIPKIFENSVNNVNAAALVLGLMATGAGMRLNVLKFNKLLSINILSIKHFILPIIALLMIKVFKIDSIQAQVLLLFSGLPTASSCYILAANMGYNAPYTAALVSLSTLLGLVSLPFAFYLFKFV